MYLIAFIIMINFSMPVFKKECITLSRLVYLPVLGSFISTILSKTLVTVGVPLTVCNILSVKTFTVEFIGANSEVFFSFNNPFEININRVI